MTTTQMAQKGQHKKLGNKGEDIAAGHLEASGFRIVERNWKCKCGEADIIAYEGDELVFVEVKTRTSTARGFPEEAVTAQKRSKYEGIALRYLASHILPSAKVRFDVISLVMMDEKRVFLRHHRDAFSVGE